MNEREITADLAPTDGYRYAEVVGDQLFTAGQVPLDVSGALVGAHDPGAQARRCLDNLRILLELHGFSVEDVRQVTVHVVGPHRHLLEAWDAVRRWFGGEVPPASLLGAAELGHSGQLVEIDTVVVRSTR